MIRNAQLIHVCESDAGKPLILECTSTIIVNASWVIGRPKGGLSIHSSDYVSIDYSSGQVSIKAVRKTGFCAIMHDLVFNIPEDRSR